MTDPLQFDLRIVFTGICSFVTDTPLRDGPKKLHLVIPDAWDTRSTTEYKGIDDKCKLVRHGALIQLPVQNLEGMEDAYGGRLIWHPKRHNLRFDCKQADDADNAFRIVPGTRKMVADMTDIASKFSHVGRDILGGDPPKEILANATFHGGKLSAEAGEFNWGFEGTLRYGGQGVEVENMAYKIVLTFEKLTEVNVKAVPFYSSKAKKPRPGNPGSTEPAEFKLVGTKEGRSVEIIIANACDVNPLDWRADNAAYSNVDRDFKWHYELLYNKKKEVYDALAKKELPHPMLKYHLGGGRNCVPAFWTV